MGIVREYQLMAGEAVKLDVESVRGVRAVPSCQRASIPGTQVKFDRCLPVFHLAAGIVREIVHEKVEFADGAFAILDLQVGGEQFETGCSLEPGTQQLLELLAEAKVVGVCGGRQRHVGRQRQPAEPVIMRPGDRVTRVRHKGCTVQAPVEVTL